ncbi:MAG: Undecaprenyl pyrophosphate phosphatase [Promethearchaeota archaeon]|nr:MAG: Undecaprenyl pyrophosphate phosphatase [Candidatus Lokiarchaeota archaeon]
MNYTISLETSMKEFIEKIEKWDFKVFLELYESDFSKRSLTFAKIYSFFGNIYFWLGVWLVMIIGSFISKDYYLLFLFTGGFFQTMSIYLIIRYGIISRNRPYITLKERGVKGHDEYIKEHKSFPSGHVTFFIFFGCIFSFHFNDYFWLIFLTFLGLDIIMALTRLILGVHFPTDVIFGLVFGLLFAALYLGLTYPFWVDFYFWLGRIVKLIFPFL